VLGIEPSVFQTRGLVTILFIYLWFYSPFVGPSPLFSFLILYTVGRTPWTGYQPIIWPLPAHTRQHKQNKRTQRSVPQVGFDPTVIVFERGKKVLSSDRAATTLHYTTLHYTALHYTTLHYTTLHCTALHYTRH
jgi:hypothetical protein